MTHVRDVEVDGESAAARLAEADALAAEPVAVVDHVREPVHRAAVVQTSGERVARQQTRARADDAAAGGWGGAGRGGRRQGQSGWWGHAVGWCQARQSYKRSLSDLQEGQDWLMGTWHGWWEHWKGLQQLIGNMGMEKHAGGQ